MALFSIVLCFQMSAADKQEILTQLLGGFLFHYEDFYFCERRASE